MTYFVGRGERDVDDVRAGIDLAVTGPHASAAFPASSGSPNGCATRTISSAPGATRSLAEHPLAKHPSR